MENIEIRRVAENEIVALQGISRETFKETFAESNTTEDMQDYLTNSFSIARLTEELHNPGSQFFLALHNGSIAGYLKVNTAQAQTELKNEQGLEVERLYVLSAWHGKRVGQLLFSFGIELAVKAHAPYVWLGVWEENARAIGFYTKNGFVAFDKHTFKVGNDVQTDLMMKKIL